MAEWDPKPEFKDIVKLIKRNDFHGVVDALMKAWLKKCDKQRWGEKIPWHMYFWREILEGFPEAKFISIVRDGRDAALSWQKARFGPKHIYQSAKRWKHFLGVFEEFKKNVKSENLYELRYEDLLVNPDKIVKEICEFIGEDYSDVMLAFHKTTKSYPTDKNNDKNLTQPLVRSNMEKWRQKLSAHDLRIFEAVVGQSWNSLGTQGWRLMLKSLPPKCCILTIFFIRSCVLFRWQKTSKATKTGLYSYTSISGCVYMLYSIEVGCGNGGFLLALEKARPDLSLIGIDIVDPGTLADSNVKFYAGQLEDQAIESGSVDLIYFDDLLEHVENPVLFLEACHRLLKPSGVVFGITPDHASLDRLVFQKFWAGYHYPRHTFLFDHHNITQILNKTHFSGVKLKGSNWLWVKSIKNITMTLPVTKKRGLIHYGSMIAFYPLDLLINLFMCHGEMSFIARKKA